MVFREWLQRMEGSVQLGFLQRSENPQMSDQQLWQEADEDGEWHFQQTRWSVHSAWTAVADRPDARDGVFTFRLNEGELFQAAIRVRFDFAKWSQDNYVLIPAAVYNGNRFRSKPVPYPPIYKDEEDLIPDMTTLITDIPRLTLTSGNSLLEVTTQDAATPAIGVFSPALQKAFWLLTTTHTEAGTTGIVMEEQHGYSEAVITLSAPSMRSDVSKGDHGATFRAGDCITLSVRLYITEASCIQHLFDRFADIRKDVQQPKAMQHQLPFSEAFATIERKYNEMNWHNDTTYYAVGMRENQYQDWQCGWVGGGMSTYPLLRLGGELSRDRAVQTLHFLFSTQAESGFFQGMYTQGRFYGDGFDREDSERWHLLRKSSDVLYFVLKQIRYLEKAHADWLTPLGWIAGTQRLADAFVQLWTRYGQFGQFVDITSGDIIVGGSTSAAIAPAGLVLAYDYFGDQTYLRIAEESAEHYYVYHTRLGVTTGGPGEILQCPDSESAFSLLESFQVLYEYTQDAKWLARSEEMAKQCMSWVVSYDFEWPEGSEFHRLGMRSTGTVFANTQNKHSAPGICTLSGDSLFKLYRATGNKRYLSLIQDISHSLMPYMSREDRIIRSWDGIDLSPGWVNERVNLSDWEGSACVGGVFAGSCWSEVALMLTSLEIPGLYVQPDTGFLCVLDHIEAQVDAHTEEAIVITVTNPTRFAAQVLLFIENESEMRGQLCHDLRSGGKLLELAPGESRTIRCVTESFQLVN
ncbi:hypothetical protein A8709_31205 [Paenibacillus pectinilyticus]|uniref:Uncharacterized protein n=1 Tax=Paenibacillus pectinilyticus TaxID=512399 RepID=A0A1C0ZW19_9BACL|nr:hypothetical protein [Paenibacillus pectinilyticus]OCT12302.1 hypothetical protein A8709_31205 [Paenibacillus pectinilyticus]